MDVSAYNGVVPANLRRIIRESGLKQGAVARRAGLKDQQLSYMLNGRQLIKVSDMQSLANALNVSVQDLVADEAEGDT